MLINFTDACSSVYCVFPQQSKLSQDTGEVFDERTDCHLPEPPPRPIDGTRLITLCAVLLVAGLTYWVSVFTSGP
jgi:hypothetical protein